MPAKQDKIFADSEGDQWFTRNTPQPDKFDSRADPVCRIIELYNLKPRRVIEIGACNGVRLEAIRQQYQSKVTAVDVSKKALADGRSKFPHIEFVQGAAHAIPTRDSFDLVIINFVFHWIDRGNLLRSVGEIDRLVEDGGFLVVGDFYPSNLTKVRYHHLPEHEVYTYKQNYAEMFVASGLYSNVCLLTGDHSSRGVQGAISEDDRTGAWLLHKNLEERYLTRALKS